MTNVSEKYREYAKNKINEFIISQDICFHSGGKQMRDLMLQLVEDIVNEAEAESWASTADTLPDNNSFIYMLCALPAGKGYTQHHGLYENGRFISHGNAMRNVRYWIYELPAPKHLTT